MVAVQEGRHHLDHPDRFWDVVLGSGYRATADALGPGQRDQVRARLLAELRADGGHDAADRRGVRDGLAAALIGWISRRG